MKLPQPGEAFEGRYTVVDALGEGGFAIVYRARDAANRIVALKVLKPEREGYSREIQSRFEREVRVLAQLRDPHTVRLFDHGRAAQSGLLFMVFEFIDGRDLSEVLAVADRLEPMLVIRILRQIASALREAHARGLLHRDLKPANVRVFEYGGDPWRVKLLDFGIARPMLAGEANITKTGELIGTPRYMSPEQLMGAELTPASDVYSLGLVGLEMLMGTSALRSNSWGAQIDRLQTGHVFSLPEMERAGVGLIAVIQKMAARRPEERYRSMDEVLAAFDALERGEPIPSKSFERAAASQSVEFVRARREASRLKVIAGFVVLLTIITGFVAYKILQSDAHAPVPPPRKVERPSLVASPDEDHGPAATDLGVPADLSTDVGPADVGPTPGCGNGAELAGKRTALFNGNLPYDRALFVPSDYDPSKAYPLIVAFHEDWQPTDRFLAQTELEKSADERGYVLLAPLGTTDGFPWRTRKQVAHIKELVDDVGARVCIDPDRIFLFGHGSGGNAAQFLSCDGWAAAMATTSYRPGRHEKRDLCAGPPIPHLQFHAMEGKRMPVNGGGTLPCAKDPKYSVAELEQHWFDRNQCSKRASVYRTEPTGRCMEYDCVADLVSCRLRGGHGFPGGTNESPVNLFCDPPPADFPAREIIFNFFDNQPGKP